VKKIRYRFAYTVYAIIYSIRNSVKAEVLKRTEFYRNLYKPKQKLK
jgi:hypothetical protein